MIDAWLEGIGSAIQNSFWAAPLLALAAGVLTSFTPCCLSSIPLVIGYVGYMEADQGKAFRLSLVFAAGAAVTFTILGITASLMGRLLGTAARWWYFLLGLLMVLMALQVWEIFQFIPSTYLTAKNKRRGYTGAFIAGILGGLFSSPCATPVLVALLAVVAGKGSPAWGALLLLFYALGHGTLTVIAGTSLGLVQKLSRSEGYARLSQVLKVVMGGAILLLGFYLFYLAF
ncbi:MAG: cytochrome c biogenesis protein CcdA [Firmicutes bacterium]|nr:cytochrome c biogenesis protein CcdA [Bacillota bacterium]